MSGINIKRFLNNFGMNRGSTPFQTKGAFNANTPSPAIPQAQAKTAEISVQNASVSQNISQNPAVLTQNLQLNTLQNMDRSVYAKEVLGFPKNINEFVYMLQRGLTQNQFNQMYANQLATQRNTLSQLQAQILAQLQGLATSTTKEMVNIQLASQMQSTLKKLEILSSGMIKLDEIALLLQKNGKDGITKLIMSMTEASKAGITDLSQMKEMAKLINASISVAAENNPQKTLKLLLMLYLPWLPLEDGVGFDLEIQQENDEHQESDSILVISVTTINYGTVKATLILESSNAVQVTIDCSEEFPKKELSLRTENDQKFYSIDSVITYKNHTQTKDIPQTKQYTAINTSQTTEINPYLLLMAHTLIKHIIEIDNNKSLGINSHIDKF